LVIKKLLAKKGWRNPRGLPKKYDVPEQREEEEREGPEREGNLNPFRLILLHYC